MEKFLPAGRFDDFRSTGDSIILLSGPPSSGKTSLVFQFAINSATASAGNVVFICNRRKLESKPPYLAQGIDPSSDVINRIQMKYVDDEEGIKKYFAAFHMHDPAPVSVIVDDFADFFDQGYFISSQSQNRYVSVSFLCMNFISETAKRDTIILEEGIWRWFGYYPYVVMRLCMLMRRGHVNFYSPILIVVTPQGCYTFTRDGSLLSTQSKRMASDHILLGVWRLPNLRQLNLQNTPSLFSIWFMKVLPKMKSNQMNEYSLI